MLCPTSIAVAWSAQAGPDGHVLSEQSAPVNPEKHWQTRLGVLQSPCWLQLLGHACEWTSLIAPKSAKMPSSLISIAAAVVQQPSFNPALKSSQFELWLPINGAPRVEESITVDTNYLWGGTRRVTAQLPSNVTCQGRKSNRNFSKKKFQWLRNFEASMLWKFRYIPISGNVYRTWASIPAFSDKIW
jgi:hypothetical protein